MLTVSFYSYKGGSGRSTTAWNTIQQLVEIMKPTKEHPFVIVDTDMQSAGVTYLFRAEELFKTEDEYWSIQKRMVDALDDDFDGANSAEKKKFFGTMLPIGRFFGKDESEKESVLLIGANVGQSADAKIDEKGLRKGDSQQIRNFREGIPLACKACGVKALFFDTPSGTQFLARMSVQQSDVVVCCMRPTRQFRLGTFDQLEKYLRYDKAMEKGSRRKYILTPTAICVDPGQKIDSEDYPRKAHRDITSLFSADGIKDSELAEIFKKNVILDMLTLTRQTDDLEYSVPEIFGIPEVKRFKWFEQCLGTLSEAERSGNDNMALKRYNLLAQTIKRDWREE